jgi:menaquinone-dependent protoporphyrinogen IX oxidase
MNEEENRPLNGAVLYYGKHGSTRQYAEWIAEETRLPLIDLDHSRPDLDFYDYLVLGSAVYIGRLFMHKWLKQNWEALRDKPVLLFSVSGTAKDDPEFEEIKENSLPGEMWDELTFCPLRGRLNPGQLSWFLRTMLKIAGRMQKNPEARDRMTHGFDFVDREAIRPIVEWVDRVEEAERELMFI